MVIDAQDGRLTSAIEDLGIPVVTTDTIMRDNLAKAALARTVLGAAGINS
jgi:hypothetical protein